MREVVRLEVSQRCPQPVLDAALRGRRADRRPARPRRCARPPPAGTVRFWCAADERAQAQAVAAEVERLVRGGVRARADRRGRALAARRGPPGHAGVRGARDRVARRRRGRLLRRRPRCATCSPGCACSPTRRDAGAVVRALARPPVALRSVDIARCVQIARRRKLDMVSALRAATESPQLPPEARERIHTFLRLYREARRLAGQRAARPLRAPPDRPPRAAPPAGLLRAGRRRRAARRPRPPRRAGELLRAARAARDAARLRPLRRRRGRRRPARGGRRGPPPPAGAVQLMALDATAGPRARLGLRARPDLRADARRAPARRRDAARRAAEGDARARRPRRPRRRDAPAAARRDDARARAGSCSPTRRCRRPASRSRRRRSPRRRARRWGASGRCSRRSSSAPRRRCTRRSRRCATSCWRTSRGSARASASCASTPTSTSPTRSRATSSSSSSRRCSSARRASRWPTRWAGQPAPGADALAAAARGPRHVAAGRAAARRRARRPRSRGGARGAHRAVAGGVPAAPRRRARAVGLGHRDLPHLPAEVQVRARPAGPAGADAQPALRDPRPPGARALPPVRPVESLDELLSLLDWGWRRGGFGDSDEERQLRAQGRQRAAALPPARHRRARRAGLVRAGVLLPHGRRTRCAAASTASTGWPTAATSSSTTRPAGRARRAAARGRAALALRRRRARGVAARRGRSRPTSTCSTTRRSACRSDADRPGVDRRHRRRGGATGSSPRASSRRRRYTACSMCDYRIACPAAES